ASRLLMPMLSLFGIRQDLRYAVRQIWRQPALSCIVVVTLALGVGASSTAFSILNSFALRPPAYRDVDRLVTVYATEGHGGGRALLPVRAFQAFGNMDVFRAAVGFGSRDFNAASNAAVERVSGAAITGDLFELLGVPLALGRPILATEHQRGAPVAVIGHSVWTRLYGATPDVLGSTILLDGRPYSIVGVAAERFDFPFATAVWVPWTYGAETDPDRGVAVIARLRDDITPAQADAALRSASSLAADTGASRHLTARAEPLHQSMISIKHRNAATALLLATDLVLLVACANLAGLLLASMAGRRHELALRGAIGASRWAIVRQLMVESFVLAAIGGGGGVIIAQWGVDLFVATLGRPAGTGWIEFGVDMRVLLFALGVSVATTIGFGLAPALSASRVDIRGVIAEGSGQVGTGGRARVHRRLLVAGQLAVSLALVAASSSIIASSMGLEDMPTGFEPDGLLRARVTLTGAAYETPAQRLAFVDRAVAAIGASAKVEDLSVASHVPLMDRRIGSARVVVDATRPEQEQPVASVRFVAADYLAMMKIPLRGRPFTRAEAVDLNAHAAIVNETMARRYWPDGDPIGRTIAVVRGEGGGDRVTITVVGVAGDVAQRQLPAVAENQIYLPLAPASELSFVVRAAGDPAGLAGDLRATLASLDPALPVATQTMTDAYAWYVWDRRGQGLVIAALGAIALLLAALGIYGVMSLLVSSRTREIGVRMALGSTPHGILRLMIGAGLKLSATGIAAGLLLAIAATTGLASIFHGLEAFDYGVFALSAGLLGSAALIASWWPSRRAMRVDPMLVLKAER
ncbi:MAG: ADOP family duplicated permease, partial [Vicinamibacterales bacterium]